ncbi:hypothetical protein [Vibrio mexicanus]|uniref:hypothetical protein n=1 Tax=Vibrio mexicanus TaxID=1004326 RepID=UPI00063C38C0|nr:hypothetical protein [Vibrio mexicanus]
MDRFDTTLLILKTGFPWAVFMFIFMGISGDKFAEGFFNQSVFTHAVIWLIGGLIFGILVNIKTIWKSFGN